MKLLKSIFKKDTSDTLEIINFNKLFRLFGLYTEIEGSKVDVIKQVDYLGEHRKYKTRFNKCLIGLTDYGYIERFRIPYTFTSDDVEGLKEKLELQTNKSIDIEIITTNNGAYFDIKVYNHKLKEKYNFELIEPSRKDKIQVALGYGRLGLIKFNIDKHIGLFGESGSGKSTTLKAILTQLVLNYSSKELQLYLSDNKGGTELNIYSNIEHTKAFTKDINGLKTIFRTLSREAEARYNLLFDNQIENIFEYNKKFKSNKLPTIILVIEEFVGVYKDKTIQANLQLALSQWRSIGIYCLITTQRPSSKILTGDLKCNLGIILGLKTLDSNNSNVVIDRFNLLNHLRGNGHGYIRHDGILEEFQSFYIDHKEVLRRIYDLKVEENVVEATKDNIAPIKKVEGKEPQKGKLNNTGEVKDFSFLDNI